MSSNIILLCFFLKKTIFHLLLLWCFKERTGGWNVFWLARHIKACIKTKIETQKTKKFSSGVWLNTLCLRFFFFRKINWIRMIYIDRERNGSVFFISNKFVHLLQCRLNMLQEGWIEISQRNGKKNQTNHPEELLFFFSKNHKITWRTNRIFKPTKTGGTR